MTDLNEVYDGIFKDWLHPPNGEGSAENVDSATAYLVCSQYVIHGVINRSTHEIEREGGKSEKQCQHREQPKPRNGVNPESRKT